MNGEIPNLLSAGTDGATGLPWFSAVRDTIEAVLRGFRVHVIAVRLIGLDQLADLYGSGVAEVTLRQIVRRLRNLLSTADVFARLDDSVLIVVTSRAPDDVRRLPGAIQWEIGASAIQASEEILPTVQLTMADGGPAEGGAQPAALLRSLLESLGITVAQAALPVAAAAPSAAAAVGTVQSEGERPSPSPETVQGFPRISLEGVSVTMTEGYSAAATCSLSHLGNRVSATVSGENTEQGRLGAVAEAAAEALTKLLPRGAISARQVMALSRESIEGISVAVDLEIPPQRIRVLGIAPIADVLYLSVARAVLNATNRKIEVLLTVDRRMPL